MKAGNVSVTNGLAILILSAITSLSSANAASATDVSLGNEKADPSPQVASGVDPERMYRLQQELRCLVCQNQSIADSHAPLAADLRNELERLMREGRSDDEIREWMVSRYGDFVLYRPPFKPTTWALWLGPFVLLALGGIVVLRLSRGAKDIKTATSSVETVDKNRLAAALKKGTEKE